MSDLQSAGLTPNGKAIVYVAWAAAYGGIGYAAVPRAIALIGALLAGSPAPTVVPVYRAEMVGAGENGSADVTVRFADGGDLWRAVGSGRFEVEVPPGRRQGPPELEVRR